MFRCCQINEKERMWEKLSWAQIFSRGERNVSQAANCILTVMLEESARGPPESVGFNRGKNNTTFSSFPFINRYSLSITKVVDQLSTHRGDDASILTRLKLLISQILLHRIPYLTKFFNAETL